MNPPPIHDSDRKAAEEIMRTRFCPDVDEATKELALIIACHHAEERAAEEARLHRLLKEARNIIRAIRQNPHELDYDEVSTATIRLGEALTALRTASQSQKKESACNCGYWAIGHLSGCPDIAEDLAKDGASQSPTEGKT